jgi:hypothetical protein
VKSGLPALAFFVAAVSAPPLSVLAYFAAAQLVPESGAPLSWGVGDLVFTLIIATVWGVVPSLVFGGVGLTVLHQVKRAPTRTAHVLAGGGAAALYLAASAGLHSIAEYLAVLVAPWVGALTERGPAPWLVSGAILLSGFAAGLIYSLVAKRG